jgi:bacterioferritin-associated ferredoxin
MIICICNALSDKSLKEARKGCNSECAENLLSSLGCKPQCGQCLCAIDEMLTRDTQPSQ